MLNVYTTYIKLHHYNIITLWNIIKIQNCTIQVHTFQPSEIKPSKKCWNVFFQLFHKPLGFFFIGSQYSISVSLQQQIRLSVDSFSGHVTNINLLYLSVIQSNLLLLMLKRLLQPPSWFAWYFMWNYFVFRLCVLELKACWIFSYGFSILYQCLPRISILSQLSHFLNIYVVAV